MIVLVCFEALQHDFDVQPKLSIPDYTPFSHLTSQSSCETSSVSSVLHMRKMKLNVIIYLPPQGI